MKRLGGCVQGIAILVTALAAAYLALQPGHTAAFLSGLLAGIAGMAVVGYSTEADRTLECEREVRQIIREVDAQEAERKPA